MNHQRTFSPCRGFSLVELLVVIGVIGVIIAILLPTIAKARDSAKLAVCTNNLRQIGHATFDYAARNGGYIPAFRSWEPAIVYTNGFSVSPDDERPYLSRIIGNKNIMYCPFSDWDSGTANSVNGGSGGWDVTIPTADSSVGYSLIGWWVNIAPNVHYPENFVDLPPDPVSNRPTKLSIPWKADQIAIAVDAQHSYTTVNHQPVFYFPGFGPGWSDGPDGALFYPHRRHDGSWDGSNAVYFDGHVEYKKREQLFGSSGFPYGYKLKLQEGRPGVDDIFYW